MKQILVNSLRKNTELLIVENNKIVEYYSLENKVNNSIEGNIYVGVIEDVVKGMQSYFVNIGLEKKGFLHFQDVYFTDKILSKGDKIIVQIKKDEIDNKGCKLTTSLSFIGRYLVLTPNNNFIAISKKIEGEKVREQYANLIKNLLPKDYGCIVRTNIIEASDEEIEREIKDLCLIYDKIRNVNNNIKNEKINLVYQQEDIINRTLKDMFNKELEFVVVNNRQVEKEIVKLAKLIDENNTNKVKYVKSPNLVKEYHLESKLEKDFQKKVWLNCGGYIVINKTEALTAIDVNSGKFTGKNNLEDTVFIVNKEAAVEIMRQLRLRNVGGIIIVDFIDMKNEENKQEIMNILEQYAKHDRSKVNIKGYTRLNLMEITRKKKNV